MLKEGVSTHTMSNKIKVKVILTDISEYDLLFIYLSEMVSIPLVIRCRSPPIPFNFWFLNWMEEIWWMIVQNVL